jgi:hypothetical protein
MGAELDEQRLRQALDDMTADQPPVPPGRYDGIRLRAARRRRNLIAGPIALLAAVAAAAGVGLSVSGSLLVASGSRQVPGWALSWPDHRNGSVPQRVLDRAVRAWHHDAALSFTRQGPGSSSWQNTAPTRVIWYVGQTVAGGQDVVAVFEVATPLGNRLVTASAETASVMHGQPAWSGDTSPWVIYSVRAPSPRRQTLAIGVNVSAPAPDQSRDSWIVELTGPAVHALVVLTTPRPDGEAIAAYGTAGLLIRDVGQVAAPVQVSAQLNPLGRRVRAGGAVPVGLPGSPASEVPSLVNPAPLTTPGGTATEDDAQGSATDVYESGAEIRARLVIARCYGPAPLRIAINGRAIGTITCDDAQHELRLPGNPLVHVLDVSTSRLTSYRVGLGQR